MNKDKAIETLIALACCTVSGLSCLECPMYEEYEDEEFGGKCGKHISWDDDDDVARAIEVLMGEQKQLDIVRCGECRFWKDKECTTPNGLYSYVPNPNWFCASGMRKD